VHACSGRHADQRAPRWATCSGLSSRRNERRTTYLEPIRTTGPGRLLTLLGDSTGSIGALLNGEALPVLKPNGTTTMLTTRFFLRWSSGCLTCRDNGMDPAAALEQALNVREIALSTLDERTLQPYVHGQR
jgi:hypothetical protein